MKIDYKKLNLQRLEETLITESNINKSDIKDIVKKELEDYEKKIQKSVIEKFLKDKEYIKDKEFEKYIGQIISDKIGKFHKAIYFSRSFWENEIR
jgi:Na+-translocating ferredoxin:NAD+ oxidoreductase RnfG subunit